jgi:hypothetical protein
MPEPQTATDQLFYEPSGRDEEIVTLDGEAPWSFHRTGARH